jgi:VanZ family protein
MRRRRAAFAALGLSVLGFVAYGSLVPLTWRHDVTWAGATATWRAMAAQPVPHVWRGDVPVNVLLFLPVGFFLTGALAPRSRHGGIVTAVIVAAAVGLVAMALEFAQLFVSNRTASRSDVFALSLGGFLGAAAWPAAGSTEIDRLTAFLRRASIRQLEGVALSVYTAAWACVSLLPLLFPPFAYPLVRSVWLRGTYQPTTSEAAADWVMTALAVVPLGMLAGLMRPPAARIAASVAGGVAITWLDRLAQVTPLAMAPEPAARVAGVLIGAAIAWAARGQSLTWFLARGHRAAMMLAVWSGVLILATWAPFDFGVPEAMVDARIEILYRRAPLQRHYWAPPLSALNAVLTMFLLALPMAVLWRIGRWRAAPAMPAVAAVLLTTSALALLEWGQLYLPARRADLTDVIIGAAGAVTGAWIGGVLEGSRRRPQGGS